jgi:single-strand DNA-binding protein
MRVRADLHPHHRHDPRRLTRRRAITQPNPPSWKDTHTLMANETTLTVIGNLTGDPEVRFLDSGAAMAKFTVASTPRTFDKNSNEWKDGEAMFLACTAWRQLAENTAESLTKGTRVVVTGRLRQHHWDTPEGEKRSMFQLDVEEIGPSLKFATAKVTKATRANNAGGGNGATPPDDPWATASRTAPTGTAGGGFSDEPPF